MPTTWGLSLSEAASRVGMGYNAFRKKVDRLGFTVVTPFSDERGPNRRVYLPPAEVEAFAKGGLPGLRAYQRRAKRPAGAKP